MTKLVVVTSLATVCAALLFMNAAQAAEACAGHPSPCVKDFSIRYPDKPSTPPDQLGSTHEITFNRDGGKVLWITAPNYHEVVEIGMQAGAKFHPMPDHAMPHGISFDAAGRLWVSFEHLHGTTSDHGGQIAQLDPKTGKVLKRIPVNADPHGLGIGPDGKTIWFTGKTKNTVGKISSNGNVVNFPLATPNALPIYIAAAPDGNMWFTELTGNKIGRVTPDGTIAEYVIPTPNSRPIAIVPDPAQPAMWFSEEAGNKVARIDMQGHITEFAVPKSQANVILAGLAFDADGNLWTQQYVDQNNPNPPGPDHIVMIGKSILTAKPSDKLSFTFYEVPTQKTVMHRIIQGPDRNMWFTELKSDKIGRVNVKTKQSKM